METCLTIYVTFEGLGFCCFNPERDGAEIALLRLPEHNLEITVTGSDGRKRFFDKIPDDAKIELVSEETRIQGYERNNDGDFDRKEGAYGSNDPSDLRWLIDCESDELHGKQAQPKTNMGSVRDLTEMFLTNAYFYTEQVLSEDYKLERYDGTATETKPFGLVGDTLGARVDAVRASLRINGRNLFQFDEGVDPAVVTRFFVSITNTCVNPPDTLQSDFYKYYEVMDFEENVKFDFRLADAETPKFRPRPAMCEFVLLSKTNSLAAFFDN